MGKDSCKQGSIGKGKKRLGGESTEKLERCRRTAQFIQQRAMGGEEDLLGQ